MQQLLLCNIYSIYKLLCNIYSIYKLLCNIYRIYKLLELILTFGQMASFIASYIVTYRCSLPARCICTVCIRCSFYLHMGGGGTGQPLPAQCAHGEYRATFNLWCNLYLHMGGYRATFTCTMCTWRVQGNL